MVRNNIKYSQFIATRAFVWEYTKTPAVHSTNLIPNLKTGWRWTRSMQVCIFKSKEEKNTQSQKQGWKTDITINVKYVLEE